MDPAKLKVVELRAQLSQRGLDTKGKKEVLVERLRMALDEENASRDQARVDANAENAHDTTVKENSEKVVETARSVQPPKTPGRASRSSSMTTPTKISTRSGPKTSTTPNSMRQPSPIKTQRAETACDILPTISESTPEEKEVKEPQIIGTPEKTEERQTRGQSKALQNEVSESPTKLEDKLSNSSGEEAAHVVTNVSEVTETDLPKVTEPVIEPSEGLKDEVIKEKEVTEESVTLEEETVEELKSTEENENSNKEESLQSDNHMEEQISEKIDNKPETEETVEDIEEHIEVEHKEQQMEHENEDVHTDASEDNSNNDPSSDSGQQQDLKMDTNNINDRAEIQTDEPIEGKPSEIKETSPILDETQDNSNKEEEQQDVEMTEEVSEKIKEEEDLKPDMQEDEGKNEYHDRKRKRSPSPIEDHETSPAPVIAEDEPEIDESALVLSWYDSDLNLVIDKDGFFTATPMHGDDFSHMWAGARASYGFLNGKVYYEAKIVEYCPINAPDDKHLHMLRIGWSVSCTSTQLGEENLSYGYDNSGKKSTNNEFVDYGPEFDKNDIIGCYLDATSEDVVILSYTVNGKDLGTAFTVSKQELDGKPLFPHILSKNCSIACNFGQENAWSEEILPEYVSIGNVDSQYKVPGPRRSERKEDCEVIMMCGLPASGKTAWASKYAAENPQKLYNVLGIDNLIQKMKHMGLPCKENYSGSWEMLIKKCTRALNKLLELAATRRRNYILDQTNVYPSTQRRKMKNFYGYQRKAVVIVPTEEEFKSRATKHKPVEGKEVADSELMEMKANFSAPVVGEYFDAVDWVELNEEDGKKLIQKYNKEGKQAGFGEQQAAKRPRIDKSDGSKEGTRDGRNNRDNHRRNNYQDRNRNPMWRGGGNMGWRERQRGGHIRHGGGYGPPAMPWRGRAPIPPPHRGMDRRGIADRRSINDRTRASGPRWGSMSGYQGSQQGVWGQQGNWSGGQSSGWGQQGGWGQQWGSWKGYGQGSYGQTNYNQQGYGNGNWNSWNQQYYNQYWGQQQQTGQTTAAGGGQAACTTENVTTDPSSDLATDYSYPQE